MSTVSEMCDRAKADGAQELIEWLEASPNGGHNRLTPEDAALVGNLMNAHLSDRDVMAVWIALQRDVQALACVHAAGGKEAVLRACTK